MRSMLAFLLAVVVLSLAHARAAAGPVEANPGLDRRAAAISQQLRCVVCQNQTIADSQAELAIDLRKKVREMLERGMSDQQVVDYVVQRYGDFVLYRPPVTRNTLLLWFGPALFLAAGLLVLAFRLSRQGQQPPPLAPEALARAARLLDDEAGPP